MSWYYLSKKCVNLVKNLFKRLIKKKKNQKTKKERKGCEPVDEVGDSQPAAAVNIIIF